MNKRKIFINFNSFLNTRNSIYEIEIKTDKNYEDILIKPEMKITSMIEKHFKIKADDFKNAKYFKPVWNKIRKKYPQKYYKYISFKIGEIEEVLNIYDFYITARIVYPFKEFQNFRNVKKMEEFYFEIEDKYNEWLEDNKELELKQSKNLKLKRNNSKKNKKQTDFDINIDEIFSKKGKLSGKKKYEYRPQQEKLALKIIEAVKKSENLMANAPTGIGKSLAYLINAIKYSHEKSKKVLISTFTKKLQDQIKNKDLPFIKNFLGIDIDITFLKGRKNYICKRRLKEFINSNQNKKIKEYVYNLYMNHGVSELDDYEINYAHREKLKSEICNREKCEYYSECIYWQLRKKAKNSSILVLNHRLLVVDLMLNRYKNREILIVDEAHHLESIITDELGGEIKYGQFDFLKKSSKRAGKIIRDWHKIYNNIENYEYEDIREFVDNLKLIQTNSSRKIADFISFNLSLLKKYFKHRKYYYVDKVFKNNEIFYKLYPYYIGNWIKKNIWQKFSSSVFLSGTLFMDDRIMLSLFKKIYNIDGKRFEFLSLKSPFDYENNVKYYIPKNFPQYDYQNKEKYFNAVVEFLKEYIKRTEGKLMVLFTSYEDMNYVKEEMNNFFQKNAIKLYINEYNQKKFEENLFHVIFGTYSMWEGVDIDNKYLKSLIMIKSPFSVPSDGFFVSKKKVLDEKMYYFYYLNNAVIKFRQGFGRLIRSRKDKGVFILLDNRITQKSYKKFFINSISKNINFEFLPVRDIFNMAEAFLFDKTGLFLKNYKKRKNTYKFLDYKQVYIARDGRKGIKVIHGAAGTGKTVILLHRLKFLLMNFPHINNVLFLTFTASLSRYIENIINLENLNVEEKNIDIKYFYSLCEDIYGKKKNDVKFNMYYQKVYKYIKKNENKLEKYDVIFVDEGQDLGELEYRIIFKFLKPKNSDLTIAIDDKQDIYRMNFQKFFKNREVMEYKLKRPYRNTSSIMKFANLFIRNLFMPKRDEFFYKGEKPIIKRYNRLIKLLNGIEDFIKREVRNSNYMYNDFVIVYPRKNIYEQNNIADTIAEFFKLKEINLENIASYRNKRNFLILDNNVKLSTIHSIKGFEFKIVIMLGIDDMYVTNRNKRLLYIASTRAKEKIFIPYREISGFIDYIGVSN
ncbi:MAG: AAA family ATPase [Candidatus Mcinerneyibacterium aminivorans]|uniref:DNA 5'-3' helicase n=1 Tax=Candidatus Mcinerneyibacterium aminivorans TaxID=2703815 RepID=A0A5D0MI42_9BACT|nr:MAG: AAA family ATPase [Candidatus Mcinerneyibacterium aminivorans]